MSILLGMAMQLVPCRKAPLKGSLLQRSPSLLVARQSADCVRDDGTRGSMQLQPSTIVMLLGLARRTANKSRKHH